MQQEIVDFTSLCSSFRKSVLLVTFFAAILPAGMVAFYPLTVYNHIMPKQIFRRIETQDWMACLQECHSDVDCSSYNFKYDSSKIRRNCELSKCAIGEGIRGKENDLLFERGFVFQQIRPNKNKSLCAIEEKDKVPALPFGGLEASLILENYSRQYLMDLYNYLNDGIKRRRRWNKCYYAKNRDISPAEFHSRCDSKGPTVTIIRDSKYIFGGYFDSSWKSSTQGCGWLRGPRAFLFSLYNKDHYKPYKFNIKSDRIGTTVYDCLSFGPTFGQGHDLTVYPNSSNYGSQYFRSFSYETPPGCKYKVYPCTFYTGRAYFRVDEIEVFYENKINS
ncbi:uncharacterized protein LOC116292689 [Actinia tenebrosa]|uniref:Uncharacterized protein LOC116292689 n=1 Tax=Actinia tenebrosa TaxID=6105 RepID=A0A6P8HTA0_ACTTE|nr:uncharacterized protein LOC116292689 [Actinia tenebrosa]